jgi:hypothetical protein
MRLEALTLPDAIVVCRAMRPMDAACIRALRGDLNPDAFAVDRWQSADAGWVIHDDAGPLFIGGVTFTTEWSGCMWLIGHERADALSPTDQTWRKLVRQTRTVITNALDPANEHARRRIDAHVMSSWPEARRLVQHLGFEHEGTCRQAGSGGEDFEIWARVARS